MQVGAQGHHLAVVGMLGPHIARLTSQQLVSPELPCRAQFHLRAPLLDGESEGPDAVA